MERGDLDEMSFAFEVLRQRWSDDGEMRRIEEVRLYDVSLVTFPANQSAKAGLSGLHRKQEPEGMSLSFAQALLETA